MTLLTLFDSSLFIIKNLRVQTYYTPQIFFDNHAVFMLFKSI